MPSEGRSSGRREREKAMEELMREWERTRRSF